jgi:hypothetical protein
MAKPLFIKDFYRKFYAAYRPIVCSLSCNDSDVSFLRAELLVALNGSNSYSSTGVLINAYKNENNTYEFNVMEYTRSYIGSGTGVILSFLNFIIPGYFETSKFKLVIWPVRYSNTAQGLLFDDLGDSVESSSFISTDTTTNEQENSDISQYHYLDRYVLGENYNNGGTATCKPLTNMPYQSSNTYDSGQLDFTQKHPTNYGVSIDISDNMTPSLYYLNGRNGYNSMIYFVRNGTTGFVTNGGFVQISYPSNTENMHKIPLHPIQLEQFILNQNGVASNLIVDASGNLIASEIYIVALSGGLFSSSNQWGGFDEDGNPETRWMKVAYTDRDNNKGVDACKRTRFHFKNSLGGYDFFNCYGTESKSISIKSTRYEKYNPTAFRGLRGKKELWVNREDTHSVISQPISNKEAIWLQELIASPLVWVEVKIKDIAKEEQYQLVAVQIVPGSYEIYNTENNVNYIEFKYTLANSRTQQRG